MTGNTKNSEKQRLLMELQRSHAAAALSKGFTHQMSNTLTGVLSHLELALADETVPEAARNLLVLAEQSARQAAGMNARLSAFLRRPESQPTPLDLEKLVDDTAFLLRRCLHRRNQVVIERVQENLWMAQGRENRVIEALVNLCLLAQARMVGGGQIVVQLRNWQAAAPQAARQSDHVGITVSHPGLALDEQTLHVMRSSPGTEMPADLTALALRGVKEIAEEDGGWLEVAPLPGTGNRFSLVLPRAAVCTDDLHSLAAEPSVAEAKRLEGTERILVADDERLLRELITAVLSYRGYRVTEAIDGEEALRKCQPDHHLVLVDVDMPGISGWDVLRQMRNRMPGVGVVLMSGAAIEESDLKKLRELGAAGWLQKPFKNPDLLQAVRDVLDQLQKGVSGTPLVRGGCQQ